MDFLKQHSKLIIIGLIFVTFGGNVTVKLISMLAPEKIVKASIEVVEEVILNVVDKRLLSIEQNVTTIESDVSTIKEVIDGDNTLAVHLMLGELNNYSTEEEIEARVDKWERETWGFQMDLSKFIISNTRLLKEVQERVVYPKVFKRWLYRAKRLK